MTMLYIFRLLSMRAIRKEIILQMQMLIYILNSSNKSFLIFI